jgi:amino acid transporter
MSEIKSGEMSSGLFVRKSSGLVRSVSTFDTFYYCLVQLAITFVFFPIAYWVFYPGAQMEIAGIIALVVAIFEGVTYGLFTSIYPRSGGEYVPLSRATHPFIGFVASFTNTFWQIFFTGTIAQAAVSFGVAPLFGVLGLQTGNQTLTNLGAWFGTPTGWFVFGMVILASFAYQLYRGMAYYFRVQKLVFSIALAMFIIFIIVLILGSSGTFSFQGSYDKYFGGGAYQSLIDAAKADNVDLMPPFDWKYTLWFTIWPAWSFFFAVLSTAFSGEIKNVKRGQLIAIPLAQLVGGVIFIATGYFARLAISQEGLLAISWVSTMTPEKFPLPYPWISLIGSILADNPLLTIMINLSALIMTAYIGASTAIYGTRGLLAWGIDGMAPTWLGKVNEKYRSPHNAIIVTFVLSAVVLAVYSFTDWIRFLQGMAGMGSVFTITTLAAALFPFYKRDVYRASPAKIEIFGIPLMTLMGIPGSLGLGYVTYRVIVDADVCGGLRDRRDLVFCRPGNPQERGRGHGCSFRRDPCRIIHFIHKPGLLFVGQPRFFLHDVYSRLCLFCFNQGIQN